MIPSRAISSFGRSGIVALPFACSRFPKRIFTLRLTTSCGRSQDKLCLIILTSARGPPLPPQLVEGTSAEVHQQKPRVPPAMRWRWMAHLSHPNPHVRSTRRRERLPLLPPRTWSRIVDPPITRLATKSGGGVPATAFRILDDRQRCRTVRSRSLDAARGRGVRPRSGQSPLSLRTRCDWLRDRPGPSRLHVHDHPDAGPRLGGPAGDSFVPGRCGSEAWPGASAWSATNCRDDPAPLGDVLTLTNSYPLWIVLPLSPFPPASPDRGRRSSESSAA